MASSQDRNKWLQVDEPPSMSEDDVYALVLVLNEVCGCEDQLSLESVQDMFGWFTSNAMAILRDNFHVWFSNSSRTPLRAACGNRNVNVKIVEVLIGFCPDFVSIPRYAGQQHAIRELCINNHIQDSESLEILKFLVRASPELLRAEDLSGRLPIHIAAWYKPYDFCKVLLDACPESARSPDHYGNLPLHHACRKVRLETVEHLLDLFPESVFARDRDNRRPIHWAVEYTDGQGRVALIQLLLDRDPTCASMADSSLNLPLHLACACGLQDVESIKLLFDYFPAALFTKNSYGNTPYSIEKSKRGGQYSIGKSKKKGSVLDFLELQQSFCQLLPDIDIMTTPDSSGMLPLHHALKAKASLGTISLLWKGNRSAVRVLGDCKSFPLHIACELATLGIVQFLVRAYDGCLNLCDKDGNFPLHRACIGGNCSVVGYLLENNSVTAVPVPNKNGKLPFHLLVESGRGITGCESLEYLEAIFLLLRAHPEALT